jgi:hypothetical protein
MRIQYLSPHFRALKEKRSKLLDPDSTLYKLLKRVRGRFDADKTLSISDDRLDLHIELLNKNEDSNDLWLQTSRINQTLLFDLDVTNSKSWGFLNKAFCLFTPQIEGFNTIPHITIAYLGNHMITPRLLEHLRSITLEVINKPLVEDFEDCGSPIEQETEIMDAPLLF